MTSKEFRKKMNEVRKCLNKGDELGVCDAIDTVFSGYRFYPKEDIPVIRSEYSSYVLKADDMDGEWIYTLFTFIFCPKGIGIDGNRGYWLGNSVADNLPLRIFFTEMFEEFVLVNGYHRRMK